MASGRFYSCYSQCSKCVYALHAQQKELPPTYPPALLTPADAYVFEVCDIAEDTANELLVRQGWDHQKVLELHCPFQGIASQPAADTDCPVCLESCVLPDSENSLSFELCGHPMHVKCAKEYVKNQVDSVSGACRMEGAPTVWTLLARGLCGCLLLLLLQTLTVPVYKGAVLSSQGYVEPT